jgi:hypothetical protein
VVFSLWFFVGVGAVALLYTVTRLVLAHSRLLQLQDGEKSKREAVPALMFVLSLLLLGVASALKGVMSAGMSDAIALAANLAMLVSGMTLFVLLFNNWRLKVAAAVAGVGAVTAWWIWPSWLTVDVFAVIATCAFLSIFLWMGSKFRFTVIIAAWFMVRDFAGVMASRQTVQAAEAQVVSARPQPQYFLVPGHWQLDLKNLLFALGVIDVAIPGAMVVVAGVYGYRHGGRWAILTGGLIGYAVGLTAGVVVNYVTRLPQAGLLYICPSVAAGIALVAWRQGLLRGLWQTSKPAAVAS